MIQNRAMTIVAAALALLLPVLGGCGAQEKQNDDFFTSGDREADQRAEQRIAREQQLQGEGGDEAQQAAGKQTLYDRLGGDAVIAAIVDDFVARALADPRVNWERKGMKTGGWFRRDRSIEWKPSADNVAMLKKHLAQFLTLATGGPAKYEGRDMKAVHKGMNITSAEFDATVGDLKASLDRLGIGTDEQKELLAVIESTRAQVVEKR